MRAHDVGLQSSRRMPAQSALGNGTRNLGWAHFWLLVMILGALLSTLAFVLIPL